MNERTEKRALRLFNNLWKTGLAIVAVLTMVLLLLGALRLAVDFSRIIGVYGTVVAAFIICVLTGVVGWVIGSTD